MYCYQGRYAEHDNLVLGGFIEKSADELSCWKYQYITEEDTSRHWLNQVNLQWGVILNSTVATLALLGY